MFFPGGTPGGGFETVVYNGAKAAEAAFGPKVTYQWSDWDPNKMITQFQQAWRPSPTASPSWATRVTRLRPAHQAGEDQGILVTVMNTELQRRRRRTRPRASAMSVPSSMTPAQRSPTRPSRAADSSPATARSSGASRPRPAAASGPRGSIETLEKAGLTVDYLEIDDATNKDPANGAADLHRLRLGASGREGDLHRPRQPDVHDPDLHEGGQPRSPAACTRPASMLSASTVQGIKDGYISLVIDQQQYLQGFQAVEQLCLTKKYGFSGLFVNTGGGFVDKSNVDVIAPLVTQQIRVVAGPPGPTTSEPADGRDSARQPASAAPPRLELRQVSKSFGGVQVLEDVGFRLGAGEVVGLLGDNGAGKSTLIKIITGVHQPDRGEILFGGERVDGLTVQKARALGVETVFQERALADDLPLWRNIFMGRPHHRPLRLPARWARCAARRRSSWASRWASPRRR